LFRDLINSIDFKDLGVEEPKVSKNKPEKEFESPTED